MMRYFARYLVVDGELRWVEGIECHDEELTQAVRQVYGLHAEIAEFMTQGIVVGAA